MLQDLEGFSTSVVESNRKPNEFRAFTKLILTAAVGGRKRKKQNNHKKEMSLSSFVPKEALAASNPSFKHKGPGLAALLAGGLGTLFGLGIGLAFFSEVPCIGSYLVFLAFFHYSEYIWVAIFHPDTLSADCKFSHSKYFVLGFNFQFFSLPH